MPTPPTVPVCRFDQGKYLFPCQLFPYTNFTSPPPIHPSGIGRGRRRNRTRQAWKIPTLAYELRTREIRFSCLELMFILGVDRFHERAGKISLGDGNLRAFLRFLESCN